MNGGPPVVARQGKARWAMRWKPAINAFAITFGDGSRPPKTKTEILGCLTRVHRPRGLPRLPAASPRRQPKPSAKLANWTLPTSRTCAWIWSSSAAASHRSCSSDSYVRSPCHPRQSAASPLKNATSHRSRSRTPIPTAGIQAKDAPVHRHRPDLAFRATLHLLEPEAVGLAPYRCYLHRPPAGEAVGVGCTTDLFGPLGGPRGKG